MAKRYVLKNPISTFAPSSKLDYRKELNESQYQAATMVEGPLLIIAGAGTGKTRTLVYRVAHLIDIGVDPRSILLLTFTRRAAEEMLRRASVLIDNRCSRVAGGTFHSFANLVLRQYGSRIDLPPSFTIMDRSDSEDAIQLLRSEMGLHHKDKRFPRKQTVAEIFSMALNKQTTVPELIENEYPHLYESLEDLLRLYNGYAEYKSTKTLVDYDDLLTKLRHLLASHEEVRRRLSENYRFIMVDEYQDTNHLQAQIVRLLAAAHDNVAVVGDDAQSIYSFRGADFRNIMDFPDAFPGTRLVKLEENYRSTQPILNLTNEIIQRAKERYEKKLYTRKQEGETPILVQAESEQMQSRFVCQKILELREEGVPLWDMAVLFRSSFHSFDLEIELVRHNIPFIKRGGFQFMETTHIKDLLAHLRVLANPHDAISWNRILLLLGGVGAQMSQKVTRWLLDGSQPVERLRTFEAKGEGCDGTQNPGASSSGCRRGGAARRAGAIPHAILFAHSQAQSPRRPSEAAQGPGTFLRHHRALSQSGALVERHGIGTAQRQCRRRAGGGPRRGSVGALDDSFRQRPGVAFGVYHLGLGRTLSFVL